MENVTRTAFAALAQTCLFLNLPYPTLANTTLNEKLSIQSGVVGTSGSVPTLKGFGVGNKGITFASGTGGIPEVSYYQHSPGDAVPFNQLPMVMRTLDNDLTSAERANYALRGTLVYNSTTYVAYWVKRFDFDNVTAGLTLKTTVENSDGTTTTTTTTYTPTQANLNPTPSVTTSTAVNTVTGNYLAASATIEVALSADDVAELQNVIELIYGTTSAGVISELCLVQGIDKTVTSSISGMSDISFTELIQSSTAQHTSCLYALSSITEGAQINLDIGAAEPMYSLASTTSSSSTVSSTTSST